MYSRERNRTKLYNDTVFKFGIIGALMLGDYHPYFDALTRKPLNKPFSISIGDHVWLGNDVLVLPGNVIEDGSIVGVRAIVKGRVPNNCAVAGSPARVVRKNVAWERGRLHYDQQLSKEFYKATSEDMTHVGVSIFTIIVEKILSFIGKNSPPPLPPDIIKRY